MELMEALIPLKVRWSALWTSYLCNDGHFLDLAQRSGLLHVNIGIESINPETLDGMNKRFNKTEICGHARQPAPPRHQLFVELHLRLGLRERSAFAATLEFLARHKVPRHTSTC